MSSLVLTHVCCVAQAAAFSSFSLFIVAHGAGLSNAFAIPSRASVLEIYPRGMWCDIYKQVH